MTRKSSYMRRKARVRLPLTVAGLLLIGFGWSCVRHSEAKTVRFADFVANQAQPTILVLAPQATHVLPVLATLRSELSADFNVAAAALEKHGQPSELAAYLKKTQPKAIVLVDNRAAAAFAELAKQESELPPAIVIMSSFAEAARESLPNATAIAFEPPAVVSLAHLRTIFDAPVKRVGVLYRAGFERFIEEEQARAKREYIDIIAMPVPERPSSNSVGRALRALERARVDAIWVTNDNALLSRRMLTSAWLPFAKKVNVPIVVGVPALVTGDVSFGTYAAVPDPEGLGLQTAELVYRLQEKNWNARELPLQPAYSVKTYLNVEQARTLGVDPAGEHLVDVLVTY